ncbi:MAG TPA: ATP-binding protein, partial [Ramlibacter sp.]|nr:ATP-binding protein [Ramlibacter sp.]
QKAKAELELRVAERTRELSADLAQQRELAATAVFRIFQEMLSNVGRHAQASRVAVRIASDGGRLRITVEDNGSGAPPQAFESSSAYGVMGMRERARQLGGHLAIASEIGHGSAFTLVLPYPAPQ